MSGLPLTTDAHRSSRGPSPAFDDRAMDGRLMAGRIPHRDAISRLRQLLAGQHPYAYCDGCLAFHLAISFAEAKTTALTVAGEPGFNRQRRDCYGCGRTVEMTALIRQKLLP